MIHKLIYSKKWILLFIVFFTLLACAQEYEDEKTIISERIKPKVKTEMISKFGEDHRTRIESGVNRMASIWWKKDGSKEEFEKFCLENFIADPDLFNKTFRKIEENFEVIQGYTHQINRAISAPVTLDLGEPISIDYFFAKSRPEADYFSNKLAFFIMLNFPHYSLEEKIKLGSEWTREEWAKVRIGDLFTSRIPKNVREKAAQERSFYFQKYFFYMDRLLTPDHKRLFIERLRLNCHNGLRGEIRAQYVMPGGLARQEMIYKVILRIIDQSVPKMVINDPEYYWDPESNQVFKEEEDNYTPVSFEPEGNARYQVLLKAFKRKKMFDPFNPSSPTVMKRTFDSRQIPEEEVERLLISVMASEEAKKVAGLIKKRIGRELRPFDMWYNGFQAQGTWSERELDRIIKEKYPTPKAFQDDIPNILLRLGFSEEKAKFLGDHIAVDPVRMGGHASGAQMRGDKAHARISGFEEEGLVYKGYRIGMHELGHCVGQNLSLNNIDYYFLKGFPTSAFSEGIADLFAYRNIKALGLGKENPLEKHMNTLAIFWYVYEKSGVALTDIKVWRWMYAHPEATPDQLKEAVITIAKDVWNQYFAPVLGSKDSPILSIYIHMISGSLYLYNYALGNISLLQIEKHIEGKDLQAELERICKLGKLTPDLWMQRAVGAGLSTESLLKATEEALRYIQE